MIEAPPIVEPITRINNLVSPIWTKWFDSIRATSGISNPTTIAAGSVLAANTLDVLTAVTSTSGTKILTNTSGTITWETATAASVATDTIWDAAGDLVQGTGANTAAKLTKGAEGTLLRAGATSVAWTTVTFPATTTAYQLLVSTATNAVGGLTAGTDGQLLRGVSGAVPAWTTLTMPATIAAGSVFAANSANVLSDINSTTGTKYLTNTTGTISWATLAISGTDSATFSINQDYTTGDVDCILNFNNSSATLQWQPTTDEESMPALFIDKRLKGSITFDGADDFDIGTVAWGWKLTANYTIASGVADAKNGHPLFINVGNQWNIATSEIAAVDVFLYNLNATSLAGTMGYDANMIRDAPAVSKPMMGYAANLASSVDPTNPVDGAGFVAATWTSRGGYPAGDAGIRQYAGFLSRGVMGWKYPFLAIDTNDSTVLFSVDQYGTVISNSLTASLPVFTDGSKKLVSKSVADTLTALGVTATGGDTTYNYRANNLSDVANATTARSNLGLAIGTNVQAYNSNLTAINQALTTTSDVNFDTITLANTTAGVALADGSAITFNSLNAMYQSGTTLGIGYGFAHLVLYIEGVYKAITVDGSGFLKGA